MKKMLTLFSFCCVAVCGVRAQSLGRSYKTALGVKVWDGGGISFKTFIAPDKAIEVIGYFYGDGSRFTGLYEMHGDIAGAPGLKWYVGPGAHLSLYSYKGYIGDKAVAGVDGVLGLDYKVNNAPFNFSIDWQPTFEFADGRNFVGSWGGLGIRYAF